MTDTLALDTMPQYFYGIIRCDDDRTFAPPGIDRTQDTPVHAIARDGLAVIVSDTTKTDYDNTRRNMVSHTRVLEEIMRDYPVLPARFGTVAPSEKMLVEQVLMGRRAELEDKMHVIENRIELGVKAFWEEGLVYNEILSEYDNIRRLRDKLRGKAPEESYYERIRLGELIEAAVEEKREQDKALIMEALQPLAEDVKANDIITERQILNVAFLIDTANEAAFDAAIQQLDAAQNGRIQFKYVGPVPPYNFVNIKLYI